MQVLTEIISAFLQLLLFSLIPLTYYWVRQRTLSGFLRFVGLFTPVSRGYAYGLIVGLLLFASTSSVFYVFGLLEVLKSPGTISGNIRALNGGWETAAVVFIASVITTGLSEEVLFRGFIAKRLFDIVGFARGNLVQALLFGVLHGIIFVPVVEGPAPLVVLSALTAAAGYLMGWINEEKGGGSIVPGWCAHAVGNGLAFSAAAFLL